jgi:hypothetical protein
MLNRRYIYLFNLLFLCALFAGVILLSPYRTHSISASINLWADHSDTDSQEIDALSSALIRLNEE